MRWQALIRILDSSTLDILETITKYTSVIFNLNFYEAGDFTVTLPPHVVSAHIKENAYVMWKNRIGIIKYIQITDTAVTLRGPDIKSLLNQRICKGTWTGAVETVIKNIVSENTVGNRSFSCFIISSNNATGVNTTYESKGEKVATSLKNICKSNNIGWDIKLENKQLIFDIITPKTRDCIYSVRHGNVSSIEYTLDALTKTNTTFFSFKNEGLELTLDTNSYAWLDKGKCMLSDGSIYVNETKFNTGIFCGSSSSHVYNIYVGNYNGAFKIEKYVSSSTYPKPCYKLGYTYTYDDVTNTDREEVNTFIDDGNTGIERIEVYNEDHTKKVQYEEVIENAIANIVTFSDFENKWFLGDSVKLRLDILEKRITFEKTITGVQIISEANNQRVIPTFGETKNILKNLLKGEK